MLINAEHLYTKYFAISLDGVEIKHYFQYDTLAKVAAVGREETSALFDWDLERSGRAQLTIGEEYEIRGGVFVRDVAGDYRVRVAEGCPDRISDEIERWDLR